jgi:putative heme-binding domain-containing protein
MHRFVSWIIVVVGLGGVCLCAEPARVPGLRISGSPDVGKSFLSVPAYPQQMFRNIVDLVPLPKMGWLVVERQGKIWLMPPVETGSEKKLLVNVSEAVPGTDSTYGVQLHPKFAENGLLFLTYAHGQGIEDGSTLARFKLTTGPEGPVFDSGSKVEVLHWRSGGHNGAAMQFGADGFLYLTTGDSEVPSPPDPLNTGQDLDDLLSCILRLDVDRSDEGKNYSVPRDNPFVSTPNARPEIWAYGFRNPWKIAFDHETGRLWCGDVGWELWEMVHLVTKGGNYGWSAMEASQSIKPETKGIHPITPPAVAHPHSEAASITGGFVYRGKQFPELRGAYVYGDYETGKIWAVWHDGKQVTRHEELCDTPHRISTFGEGDDHELIYAHFGGDSTLHRLVRNPEAGKKSPFPRTLAETGLFADVKSHQLAAGVVPYEVAVPMWEDGAEAERFVAMPAGAAAIETIINRNKQGVATSKVTWPKDAVLGRSVKHGTQRLETQIMHFDGVTWQAYAYKWRADGSDGDLVESVGDLMPVKPVLDRQAMLDRRLHSRAECMRCHTMWTGFVNGFQPQQLLTPEKLIEAGIFTSAFLEQSTARTVPVSDSSQSVEARARSWLHANCAHCHRQHGGGSVALLLNAELTLDATKMISAVPQRGTFGVEKAALVAPGSPGHSILLHRLAVSGAGHMPILGARDPDPQGLSLLSEWIKSMPVETQKADGLNKEQTESVEARVAQWVAHARADQGDLDEAFHVLIGDSRAHALALVTYLHGNDVDEQVRKTSVRSGSRSPDAHIRALFAGFLPPAERERTLPAEPDVKLLLSLRGVPERGAALLTPLGKGAVCLACHLVGGTGRELGPDLSKVGSRLNTEALLESILKPSSVMTPEFVPHTLVMKDGAMVTGFLRPEEKGILPIRLLTGETQKVVATDIVERKRLTTSLMPEGQHQAFTAQELADVLSYLASLK